MLKNGALVFDSSKPMMCRHCAWDSWLIPGIKTVSTCCRYLEHRSNDNLTQSIHVLTIAVNGNDDQFLLMLESVSARMLRQYWASLVFDRAWSEFADNGCSISGNVGKLTSLVLQKNGAFKLQRWLLNLAHPYIRKHVLQRLMYIVVTLWRKLGPIEACPEAWEGSWFRNSQTHANNSAIYYVMQLITKNQLKWPTFKMLHTYPKHLWDLNSRSLGLHPVPAIQALSRSSTSSCSNYRQRTNNTSTSVQAQQASYVHLLLPQ